MAADLSLGLGEVARLLSRAPRGIRAHPDDHVQHREEAPQRIEPERRKRGLEGGERPCRILDDDAIAEGEAAMRPRGNVEFMGDEDHGDARLRSAPRTAL